jgi:hypothetical protein
MCEISLRAKVLGRDSKDGSPLAYSEETPHTPSIARGRPFLAF